MRSTSLVPTSIALLVLCVEFAGCTTNVGNRREYRPFVGKTVYLIRPMALWLPKSSEIKFYSYPYNLVNANWKPYGYGAFGEHIPNGSILAILPIGTPLHIAKVKNYYALDDALGTVYVAPARGTVNFDYTLFGIYPSPWSLVKAQ